MKEEIERNKIKLKEFGIELDEMKSKVDVLKCTNSLEDKAKRKVHK